MPHIRSGRAGEAARRRPRARARGGRPCVRHRTRAGAQFTENDIGQARPGPRQVHVRIRRNSAAGCGCTGAMTVVAVTGATGFIGTHLVRLLVEQGYNVRALARRPPQGREESLQLSWVIGSLENTQALEKLVAGADVVVHLAGAIKAFSRDAFLEANAIGTRRLAEAAAAVATSPRLIYVSSLAARQPSLSSYAASKRAGEQVVRSFAKLRPVILRPPAVYGPGDMETLRIFQMASRGFVLAPGGATNRTSLVHVEDVARAVVAAVKLDEPPSVPVEFDDGRARGYDWREILAAAGEALQITPRLIRVPAPLMYLVGLAGSLHGRLTGKPNVLSWDKIPELLHPDWVAAPMALAGYQPRWTLEKGLKDAVNWYASRGLLTK
ncbi:MAG: SDR family NAD(P)-dependent oxidoreductase [Rhodospirillaceae bacterium]|nr:SDR family NAD(P)-dependent oxidoreductase [Rhodospirillaceae bacterium]